VCCKLSSTLYKHHPKARFETPNPSHHCRISSCRRPTKPWLPMLSCHLEDYRSSPLLPEPSLKLELHRKTAFTIANHQPNSVTTTGLSWTVSAIDGEQNGDPLSPRSRRRRPCCVWCPVAQARSSPHRPPWRLLDALFHRCCRRKETAWSRRILSRRPRYPFVLIKI
jgi:hypothetical protein